jgi:hypothetical protein
MPGRNDPDDLLRWVEDLQRRVRILESSPQAPNSSLTAGALAVKDDDRNEILRYGKQDDGTYALAVFDNDGVEQARFGELAGGGYGSKLNLGIATVNTGVSRNVVGFGLPTAGTSPAVSIETGDRALVMLSSRISFSSTASTGIVSYAISGDTTSAADADVSRCAMFEYSGAASITLAANVARNYVQTGLTPGLNTFTAHYSTNGLGGIGFFGTSITVIPL